MNAMMLLMHCEKEGYPVARFCTFAALQRLNAPGQPLVSVLKGAKSFSVLLTTFTCVEKEKKVTIKYEEYRVVFRRKRQLQCLFLLDMG